MKTNKFIFKFLFKPSFHHELNITFDLTEEPNIIGFEITPLKRELNGLDKKEKLTVQEYLLLKKITAFNIDVLKLQWQHYHIISKDYNNTPIIDLKNRLVEIHKENRKDERIIADGIIIDCELITDNSTVSLSFHSPENNSPELILIESLLTFLESEFKEEQAINILETIEGYFDLKFPMKEFPGDPYIVRFYSRLGYSKETESELIKRLNNIPQDKPILMDFSNFEGMGTLFYDSFSPFLNRDQKIVWMAANRAKEQLLEMGVKPEHIFDNKIEACNHISSLDKIV